MRRLIRRDYPWNTVTSPLVKSADESEHSKAEKAAEPGREALAAFLNIGRPRCLDTSCRRHVRLGSKLFENACLS